MSQSNSTMQLTKSEQRTLHELEVLHPSVDRIREEGGPNTRRLYEENGGLLVYRRIEEVGESGNYIVEEGYIKEEELPNGKVLYKEIPVSHKPLEWCKKNR